MRNIAAFAAAVACAVVTTVASAGASTAAPPPQDAVTRAVPAAAQTQTSGYWTKARLESAAGQAAVPGPVHFYGVPTVGALFYTTGRQAHFCTASVVDSTRGDIILTAAHCVYGSSYAANLAYVPKWHGGETPYGVWAVTRITVARGWVSARNPDLDFAFLTVAPPHKGGVPVQKVTGGLRLGVNTGYQHKIYVIGYNNTDREPVGCAAASTRFKPSQQKFSCPDFQNGTSGASWILGLNRRTGGGTVIGDIGGYEQGGDHADVSYSPYYSAPILTLFQQAQHTS
ncbi:MAG TPA: trypsin-like serine protease [Trebonia sp.]